MPRIRGAVRTASSSEPPHRGHVSSTRDGYPASWSPCPARQAWLSPGSRSSAPCTVGLNNTAGEAAGMPAGGTQAQDGPGPGLPGGGMLGEAGGENSLTADTGHLLVQLTQGGSYIFPQCSPPHPPSQGKHSLTHKRQGDGQDGTGMGGWVGQAGSADEAPIPGSGVLMEWLITIPSHKAGGWAAAAHGLQAPDRRLPRAHANSATWSSADTGRPRRHGHGTRGGEQGQGDGSPERGLVSPTLVGRTGK